MSFVKKRASIRPVLQQFGIKALSDISVFLSTFIAIIVLTRKLSIEQFGYYSQIFVVVMFILPIATLRLNAAFVRFYRSENKPSFYRCYYQVLLFCSAILLIISSLLVVWPDILVLFFGQTVTEHTALLLVLLVFARTFFLLSNDFFRATGRLNLSSFLNAVRHLLFIGLIFFIESDNALIFASLYFLIEMSLVIIIQIMIRRIVSHEREKNHAYGIREIKDWIKYSIFLVPYSVSLASIQYIDRIFLVNYGDLKMVAKYSLMSQFSISLFFFVASLSFILMPYYVKAWGQEERDTKIRLIYSLSMTAFLIISIPSVIGFYLLFSEIITFVSSSDYIIDNKTLLIMLLSQFLFSIFVLSSFIIDLLKNTYQLLLIALVSSMINLLLNFILVPDLMMQGAVISTLVASIIQLFLLKIYSFSKVRWLLVFPIKNLCKVVGASLLMAASIKLPMIEHSHLLVKIFSGIVVYFLATVILFIGNMKGFKSSFNL